MRGHIFIFAGVLWRGQPCLGAHIPLLSPEVLGEEGHLRGSHISLLPEFLKGTPIRGAHIYYLPGVLRTGHLQGLHIHFLPRVFLGGDTCDGYNLDFHYCPGVFLEGTTYDGETSGSPFGTGEWMLKEYDWCQELSAQILSPMSINHEKYTLVIVDEYSRMVENQNHVKVKQIRTDNGTEFKNHEFESFYDEKGISHNFSSPYTLEQNGVAKRKNRTLIEVAITMLNGSVLSKHFWTEVANLMLRLMMVMSYDIPLSQKLSEFTNTLEDEIRIDDSSRYPPDDFIYEDDPSRQYQIDSDISYYVIPHGRSLSELTQENHVPEVIALNESDIPLTEDIEGPPDLINTEGTHEQNVQNEQIITQPTKGPSENNTEVLVSIN
ncbi:retrovirus-related pol polyprotein from transposon TNT 1-94 [Tanacetum coccineum]